MTHSFKRLFSPIKIGAYTLKNRIVNTGHGAHFHSGDGCPTRRYVDYVGERAKGGAGMIVVGHTVIYNDGEVSMGMANYDNRIIPWYQAFAEATHAFDVPVLVQLGHRGRTVIDSAAFLSRPLMGPSAIPSPDFGSPQIVPHAMSTREVEDAVRMFAAAAQRVREGGMDGVEIAMGMNYLVAEFLSEQSNVRSDRYGGNSLEGRMTFVYEVLDAVRAALGPDLILGVRLYDDMVHYSLGLDDLKVIAPLIEQTGTVDYLNVWLGATGDPKSNRMHYAPYYYEPGQFAYLAAAVKQLVGLPVIGAGRVDLPAVAERVLAEGQMDLVGMVKALIADPHLPNKVKEGRFDDVRPCIGCTQSCAGHIYLGMGVGCIYNPVTGREREWGELSPAQHRKTVVIVGGGPAGMEAARISAERGHRVILFERSRRLGGQISLVMKAPKRETFEEIILYFERQLRNLEVDIRLGIEATVSDVLSARPDAVVIATGSVPYRPDIPGVDQHVFSARDVLGGRATMGERVVIIDTQGRPEGASVAEFLKDQGRSVEIITGLSIVGREINPITWHHMIERMMNKGVKLTTFTGVFEILKSSLAVYNTITWETRDIEDVDSVVLATGGVADETMHQALLGQVSELFVIGDSYQARDIEVAIVDGHRTGVSL